MVEKIKIDFLGTGSAIPTAKRNHPAILLKYKAENILVDCGEGTQRQFRKAGLNPCKVTKILISHWHGDHVLGLPGLLQTMAMNGYNKKLEIYGPRETKKKFRQYIDLIGKKMQGLDLEVKEVSTGVFFDNDDFQIGSSGLDHDCSAIAYSFLVKEKKRLDKDKLAKMKIPNSPLVAELAKGKVIEIDGKKIDGRKILYVDPSRKVSFVMDTRYNESIVDFVKGSDVLISEATYSKEEKAVAQEYGHLTSVDAARIAKRAKVKSLVLIHLSQRYDMIPKIILKEAKEVFEDVIVPEDLDVVEL